MEKQWKLLCEYSNKIVVTNQYLKNRIPEHNRRKVIILPTTDGDMQGFDYQKIENAINHPFNPAHIGHIFYDKLTKR